MNLVIPSKKKDGQMLLCGSTAKSKGLLKYINFQVSRKKVKYVLSSKCSQINIKYPLNYYTSVHSSLIRLSYVSSHISRTIGFLRASDTYHMIYRLIESPAIRLSTYLLPKG